MLRYLATGLLALAALPAPPVQDPPAARGDGSLSTRDDAARPVDVPRGPGSALPNATRGADGRVRLSWVERRGATAVLRVARLGPDGAFEEPREVARGDDWFVNWADFPSVAALGDGTLCAHWLRRLGEGTYAYGVRFRISRDDGATWSEERWLHEDRTPSEHGFVSLAPMGDRFGALWLDGRSTAAATGAGEGHGGPMSLYFRTVAADGALGPELLVDDEVCDCCQTALIPTAGGGALAAWRDRATDERRDVALAVLAEGAWAQTQGHPDRWVTNQCPVNGPALAAATAPFLAWYTEGRERDPRVLGAWLDAEGAPGEPMRLDGGDPLGRVDAVPVGEASALVTWLERRGEAAVWRARRVDPDGPGEAFDVAGTSPARQSGFLRMAPIDGSSVLMAWTGQGGVEAAILSTPD